MNKDKKIRVTVYCLAFNHANYIEQTIEGFLSQNTNFSVKFIIHDDASTDNTAEIIKRYEIQYPNLIHGIYQQENQYSKGAKILEKFILPHIEGDYVAVCEGDDYWSDSSKLQRQIDMLDADKNCFMSVHKTKEIYENGAPTGVYFPNESLETGIIKRDEFLKLRYGFHTSSYVFRKNEWIEYISNPPSFKLTYGVGDVPYLLYFGSLGNVAYIEREMSCYRRGVITSWSVQHAKSNIESLANHASQIYKMYVEFDKYTDGRFKEICMSREAVYKMQEAVLLKKPRELITAKYRKLIPYLPISRKMFLALSLFAPRAMREMYMKHLESNNNKWLKERR